MIEISLGKLVLLALIALIVLGPEKLPHAARTAGALVRRLRSGWDSVRAEVERELEIEELKRTAREAAARAEALQADMNKAARDTRDEVAKTATEMRESLADVSPELTHAEQARTEQPNLDQPILDQTSVDPTPIDPPRVDPLHVDPSRVDPSHVDPLHVDQTRETSHGGI